MGKPSARIGDTHVCPVCNPAPVGPILTGASKVTIEARPAARIGDLVLCGASPDVIATGSKSVIIEGRPAARIGDMTIRGGTIVTGASTVLIGG